MKKILVFCATLLCSAAMMANDVLVTVDQMPASAQAFLKTYFPNDNIAYATADRTMTFVTDYDVRLADGTEIEFNRDGSLRKIECKMRPMPEGIVPAKMVAYIQAAFPNVLIKEYKIEYFGQKVELTNGLELIFDNDGNPRGIDD